MSTALKPKVLFLPAWYPHKYDRMAGLFVQQHAQCILPYADVAVLQIIQQPEVPRHLIESKTENGIFTYRIYLKQVSFPVIGKLINLLNYKSAASYAYTQVEKKWGTPDLCHVHILTRAGWLAHQLKKTKQIPYVISEHWSRYFPQNAASYLGKTRQKYTRQFVAEASAVYPVSEVLKSAMLTHGLTNSNYHIIPNVVDTNRFVPADQKTISNTTKFLSVTCFDEKSKNLNGLLHAAYGLVSSGKRNFHITFVGDGKDKKDIEQKVQELNLSTICTFTGVLEGDDLAEIYRKHDVLISNSNYETFCIVLAEAISCGLSVISTPTGIATQLVTSENGWLS
jgi:glycosyltransferase involved in cell wall biosynthesis